MTATEADELAKRIINTWRSGPPLTEWRTELEPLDAGMAGTAFARLKRTDENAPSLARFLATYRSVRGPDDAPANRFKPYEELISLEEYMTRLAARSAQGNTEATEELSRWERWLSGNSPTWSVKRNKETAA